MAGPLVSALPGTGLRIILMAGYLTGGNLLVRARQSIVAAIWPTEGLVMPYHSRVCCFDMPVGYTMNIDAVVMLDRSSYLGCNAG